MACGIADETVALWKAASSDDPAFYQQVWVHELRQTGVCFGWRQVHWVMVGWWLANKRRKRCRATRSP
jgi:hypothetical protein